MIVRDREGVRCGEVAEAVLSMRPKRGGTKALEG